LRQPTSEPPERLRSSLEEQAGSTPGKGCADATFTLKTALQTLREHGQESWVLFVDLVKAYDTVNREMLWKILTTLGVPESLIEVLKKLYKDVTINLRVGEKLEQSLSTSGVKQGDNLTPILFIFVIHAVSNSLDKKWDFTTPDFRWYPDTQAGRKPRGQLRGTKHVNKGTKFSFFKSCYVDDTAFILLSRGELVAASKLIVSHFRRFRLTIHTGSKRKDDGSKTEAIRTQRDEGVKISEANARRMVSNATTNRETSADHTTRIHQHPQETRL
jgi:hypothetical protein